jgi:signal transduction histidine kinase
VDLNTLSDSQLAENLRSLLNVPSAETERQIDTLQATIQSLQVHRIELEMQNRALRETQGELEHAVQRYADLYDHLPIGYVTTTARGRITEANLAAAELAHRDRRQFVGTYLGSFFEGDDAARLAAHLAGCLESNDPQMFEGVLHGDKGATIDVQLLSRNVGVPGRTDPLIRTAISNVSALKRTQRALEEITREQEGLNQSLSHDLRAPLVTIANYTKLLDSDFGAQMPEEARTMLGRVGLAASRMEHLLLMLTEYNNVQRREPVVTTVEAREIVDAVLAQAANEIAAARAEVEVGPLPLVLADRELLAQALGHLLSNALKYVAPGQRPQVRIAGAEVDSRAVLTVADEGIGVPAKYHDRIFRMFERLHGYSKYPGAGIGLGIVRRAVQRMGGRVWIESEPGKGSRFNLELTKG